jgi:uncharacterized protein
MSKVVLIKENYKETLVKALKAFGIDELANKKVLIKLHMGELSNKWYVKPEIVRIVTDYPLGIGAKPTLFDTVVLYPGPRFLKSSHKMVARKHGFGKLGCPIAIGDEGSVVESDGFRFEIPKEVLDHDAMIVISHSKGHCGAGYGGAIKNVGMGCISRSAKRKVHSEISVPAVDVGKCVLCGQCEKACKQKAISVNDKWNIKSGFCVGCGECIKCCPNKALDYKDEGLCEMLAYASKAATKHMKKMLFVNVLLDITKNCDCMMNALPVICEDIGMVVSDDIVAVDKASMDLIENKMGKTFKEVNKVDPNPQIATAEKIGIGSKKYSLENLE